MESVGVGVVTLTWNQSKSARRADAAAAVPRTGLVPCLLPSPPARQHSRSAEPCHSLTRAARAVGAMAERPGGRGLPLASVGSQRAGGP